MQQPQGVAATVRACLTTWPATVRKAAEAGYSFCLVGYFEIADSEHYLLVPALAPLLEELERQGYQALLFKPHSPAVYDFTGAKILGYAQDAWHAAAAGAAQRPRVIEVHSNHYTHTRKVASRDSCARSFRDEVK